MRRNRIDRRSSRSGAGRRHREGDAQKSQRPETGFVRECRWSGFRAQIARRNRPHEPPGGGKTRDERGRLQHDPDGLA